MIFLNGILRTAAVLLLVLLFLVLAILLVPVRYRAAGWVEDPEGGASPDFSAWKEKAGAEVRFSWLLHLIYGRFCWSPQPEGFLRILFFIRITFPREKKSESGKTAQKKTPEKTQKKAGENFQKGLKLFSALLKKKETREAFRAILGGTGRIVKILLPKSWKAEGTVGLGGPENTAKFIEAESLLLPFVCGHVWIVPQMEGYWMDVRAGAKGKITAGRILAVLVVLAWNRNVQELMTQVKQLRGGKGNGREQTGRRGSHPQQQL